MTTKKRNNLDELINIPIEAEERFVIQISFRTQGPNIRQAQSRIRIKNYSRSTIRCVFKIHKSARFTAQIHNPCAFKAKSVDPKTYSPPSKRYNKFQLFQSSLLDTRWKRKIKMERRQNIWPASWMLLRETAVRLLALSLVYLNCMKWKLKKTERKFIWEKFYCMPRELEKASTRDRQTG